MLVLLAGQSVLFKVTERKLWCEDEKWKSAIVCQLLLTRFVLKDACFLELLGE